MKRIINTTNDRIEVQIFGSEYVLEPLGHVDVPQPVADYWTGQLHTFLKQEDVSEQKEAVVETVTEEVVVAPVKKKETLMDKVKKAVKK